MAEDQQPEPQVRRPASRAEWVLSFTGLGCLVIGGSGIAELPGLVFVPVGMLLVLVVVHMTCARLYLRVPWQLTLLIPGIIALFAPLYFCLYTGAVAQRNEFRCATSMRMIGGAIESYCEDWDGKLPRGDRWNDLILKGEMNNFRDFCPNAPGDLPSYALSDRLVGKRLKEIPKDTVLLFECTPGRNRSGGPELLPPENMHTNGINVLFADGGVRPVPHSQVRKLRWRP